MKVGTQSTFDVYLPFQAARRVPEFAVSYYYYLRGRLTVAYFPATTSVYPTLEILNSQGCRNIFHRPRPTKDVRRPTRSASASPRNRV